MKKEDFDRNAEIWRNLFDIDDKTINALYADIVKRGLPFNKKLGMTIQPWFVSLVSIYERYFAHGCNKPYNNDGDDFVFVTCLDPIHRVKTLPLVAKDFKYTKFFLPSTTRPTVVKHYYNYYKKKGNEKFVLGVFSNEDIRKYRFFLHENKTILKSIKCDNEEDTSALRYYIMRYALYDIYAKRVFAGTASNSLWLFEHDKFFFIPVINEFRKKNVLTVQMQHGTFFNPHTDAYIPLYTDKIFCCSEREKSLYKEGGVDGKDIYVTGAPLQTIGSSKLDVEKKYDVVVLLTETDTSALSLQQKALKYLGDNYAEKKILLRFRPRSKERDKLKLAGYTFGFDISESTSLMEDICSAHKVLSFSEDATFEVIRAGRQFVCLVEPSRLYGHYLDGVCYTVDQLEVCIKKLTEEDTYDIKEKYLFIYGETEIEAIRQNFKNAILEIKSCQTV